MSDYLHTCMSAACRGQKAVDPLGLELHMSVSHLVVEVNCTRVLCKNRCAFNH